MTGPELTAVILVPLAAVGAAAWWIRKSLAGEIAKPREDQSLAMLQAQMNASAAQTAQQVESLRVSLGQSQAQVAQALSASQQTMNERLDRAATVISGVSKQLGQLDESTKQLAGIGKDISSLQNILRSPKLRGNLGELFLNDLLAQILPPDHYEMQYGFKGGDRVDAVIKLQAGVVPVDAKFPLENFQRIAAATSEEERKPLRVPFLRDVKKHIDAIATKYIRPDEGTLPFALMYIPAENVYYETIIKDEDFGGEGQLFSYALSRRVIPVSPNSFYAYLQTILLGLKGLRVEESARAVLDNLDRLRSEFDKFTEKFALIGSQLENAKRNYDESEKRLGKVTGKMDDIHGLVQGREVASLPQGSE